MPETKAIKLTALDGYLSGPVIEVPSHTKEWNVPISRDILPYAPLTEAELVTIQPSSMSYVTFRTKDRWIILPNGRSCELYELSLNGLL